MGNISKVSLPPPIGDDPDSLRRSVESALNKLVDAINISSPSEDLDMNTLRIKNVSWPASDNDVVIVRYLRKKLEELNKDIHNEATIITGGIENKEIRTIDLGSPLTIGSDLAQHYRVRVPTGSSIRLTSWSLEIITPPTGSSLIANYDYSTNDGSSWTAVVSGGAVLAAAAQRASGTIFTSTPLRLYTDYILRYNLTQVGSATPGSILDFVLAGVIE